VPRTPGDRGDGGRPPPIRKSLGQHFLNDERILKRIVDALDLRAGETVVEIGPGRGSLTALLVGTGVRVVGVEYDRLLVQRLEERFRDTPNLTVIQADVLTVSLGEVAGGAYKLVGNVPYYITTPILFHALEAPRPDRAVYLVQREVAERIVAAPGSDAYGALSVNVQAAAHPTLLFRVAPGSFVPPPKVESAVVRIDPLPEPVVSSEEADRFRRFVIDAFGMRRKQMRRVLRSVLQLAPEAAEARLEQAGIDPEARPETLSPRQFAALLRGNSKGQTL
jgi:16S rRNA (adenine1518-N6/adenine1519-N6)-dimethyltransferase